MKQKKEVKYLNHIKNMVFIENFMFQFLYYFDRLFLICYSFIDRDL